MKIRILIGMIFTAALMAITGCGGGGGSTTVPAGTATTVKGVASKGQFISGTVDIFGVDSVSSRKGTLLKTVSLDALGNYEANIGTYTGAVLIEVTGIYNDEATGTQKTITTPIRAAVITTAGTVSAMVTPLTEMAVKKMTDVFTVTAVNTFNANIAAAFKVEDITKTKPVDATNATATASATAAEKDMSVVLAAVSQLVSNSGNSLDKVLSDLATAITGSTLADSQAAGFKTAMFDFVSDPAKNKTGITQSSGLFNLGTSKVAHLKISTVGLTAGTLIGGIDFTFNLPVGVTISKDAASTTNQVAAGQVVVSGVAASAGSTSISLSTVSAQVLRTVLANAQGFGAGEFVDISCTIPAGVTAPDASFTSAITAASPITVTDLTGAPITGVTLSATVVVF